MINKKLGLIVTSALVAGLVACNNDAMDAPDDNRDGTVDLTENVNYNGRGPLARDIDTRYREGNELRTANRDRENNRKRNGHDDDLEISSLETDISSNNYPHTRAIAIQDAKFKFVRVENQEEAQRQAQKYIQQFRQQAEQRAQQFVQQGQPRTQQQYQAQMEPQQREQVTREQARQKAPAQNQPKAPAENKAETKQPTQGISQAAQQVIDLTNAERRKNGLPDLKGDTQLSGVAQKKSEDMRQNNYFSHTSPTYGSPFDMMRDFGVTYKTAGENIAQGQQSPQQVVQAWMNSEGHRKNILNRNFTHIGVGYDQNGHHWTQMFIGK